MTGFRRRCAVVAAVLALVPMAACSKDSKKPATASSSVSAVGASSQSSSSSDSLASSAAPTEHCDAAAVPDNSANVSHADGDFNGDSATDSLTVYGGGSSGQPAPYHAHIELGDGRGAVDAIIAADASGDDPEAIRALGGADVTSSAGSPPDGSGDEAFITVGSGASVQLVAVFQLVGCAFTRLTGPGSAAPSAFAIGGTVTHQGGLRCDGTTGGQRLVQLSATSTDGMTYTTKEERLAVSNGAFSITDTVDGSLSASDSRLQEFGTINCPGVQAA